MCHIRLRCVLEYRWVDEVGGGDVRVEYENCQPWEVSTYFIERKIHAIEKGLKTSGVSVNNFFRFFIGCFFPFMCHPSCMEIIDYTLVMRFVYKLPSLFEPLGILK